MDDRFFLLKIYAVASKLIGRDLSEEEKGNIITNFNSVSGDPFARAKYAIKQVTKKDVPKTFLLLESEGAINELANLVAELEATAKEWVK